jgi:hypothetical protein
MFLLPVQQEIWFFGEATHQAVNVILGYGLQDAPSKLVFKNPDLGAGLDAVLAAQLGWYDKLALRGKTVAEAKIPRKQTTADSSSPRSSE